jgi:DNA-binding MarR family transcriptional regulator
MEHKDAMSGRESSASASDILAELSPIQKPVATVQSLPVDWAALDLSHLTADESPPKPADDAQDLDLSFLAAANASQVAEESLALVEDAVSELAGATRSPVPAAPPSDSIRATSSAAPTPPAVTSRPPSLEKPKGEAVADRAWKPSRSENNEKGGPATNPRLNELFNRVQSLLGGKAGNDGHFAPREPETLDETGLTFEEIERLILKFLLAKGGMTGRRIAQQICLPYGIVEPVLKSLKRDQLLVFLGTAEMGDYEFGITENGRERARRYVAECTYFGAAPVPLADYLKAMEAQSIAKQTVTEADLREAFSDLLINDAMMEKLGPAINSGRGMFLFGAPGNGKTSIAERITKCFGSNIWIPRALGIDGEILRVFDPGMHEEVPRPVGEGLFDLSGIDPRWVQIVRPTIIAGGELTMEQLEVTQNPLTHICEAPLQLKSNCGTLVIDDFGRQRMAVDELLNRWIVPLEKRYDFLNLPSGKKIQVPFDQLIIFSTNLEPKDLVDGAFLRRIPYKINVVDPTEAEFRQILKKLAPKMGFQYDKAAVDHLIEEHYVRCQRPFRSCQPRDLLLQVKNYCTYRNLPRKMTPEGFDFAVENYFSVM